MESALSASHRPAFTETHEEVVRGSITLGLPANALDLSAILERLLDLRLNLAKVDVAASAEDVTLRYEQTKTTKPVAVPSWEPQAPLVTVPGPLRVATTSATSASKVTSHATPDTPAKTAPAKEGEKVPFVPTSPNAPLPELTTAAANKMMNQLPDGTYYFALPATRQEEQAARMRVHQAKKKYIEVHNLTKDDVAIETHKIPGTALEVTMLKADPSA